jgi:cold shock CspA family protein
MMPETETVIRGRVNWFDTARGLGFIERLDGGEDVYVWHAEISFAPAKNGVPRKNLYKGQIVEFEVVPGKEGKPAARNVKVVAQ